MARRGGETSRWERLEPGPAAGRVDREKGIIYGYVVAQEGPFKSRRGAFDELSILQAASLMMKARAGTKSRFTHPDLCNDGLGKFLGRARNPRIDGPRLRADLTFDPSSFRTPSGNLAGYVMDLATSDPDALSSSLVLQADKQLQLDDKGRPLLDEDGEEVPPLWRPTAIHSSDIVDTGDAVDGLLSAGLSGGSTIDTGRLPMGSLWNARALLDGLTEHMNPDEVQATFDGIVRAYLDARDRVGSKVANARLPDILREILNQHRDVGQAERMRRLRALEKRARQDG